MFFPVETTPLPTGAQEGRGWTPFLSEYPDVSEELRFARRVYPLPETTAAAFIKRMGLVEKWRGGEHNVYRIANDPEHVIKMSLSGSGAGFVLSEKRSHDGGAAAAELGMARSSLRDYIQRLQLANEYFRDDMKVLGVLFDEAAWQQKLVHQQRYRGEQASTSGEIDAMMKKYGFQRLKDANLGKALIGVTYYHQKNNILVSDCLPKNFRTVNGEAVPFDIVIAEPKGRMREFTMSNIMEPEATE